MSSNRYAGLPPNVIESIELILAGPAWLTTAQAAELAGRTARYWRDYAARPESIDPGGCIRQDGVWLLPRRLVAEAFEIAWRQTAANNLQKTA